MPQLPVPVPNFPVAPVIYPSLEPARVNLPSEEILPEIPYPASALIKSPTELCVPIVIVLSVPPFITVILALAVKPNSENFVSEVIDTLLVFVVPADTEPA